jgi:hypothetical protein
VVILVVRVQRRWLRRSSLNLWFCRRDIRPGRIVGVLEFAEIADTAALP